MSNSERKAHCNKKAYSTLLAAQIGLKKLLTRQRKKDEPIVTGMSVYKCPYCPKFHVGRSRMKGIDWNAVEAQDAKVKARAAKVAAENKERQQ